MEQGTCAADGCNRPLTPRGAHGWCPTHYMRWYRHGDVMGEVPIDTLRVQGLPMRDRFLRHVDVSAGPDACWPWLARRSADGYGRVYDGRRTAEAHRISYALFVGPIPPKATLDHLCRVRACVNPAHLEPVSIQENIRRGQTARKSA